MVNETLLKQELKDQGYNEEEINGILQGMDDLKNGRIYTPEEVYESLLSKQKVHA